LFSVVIVYHFNMKKISIHRTSKKTGSKGYLTVLNEILQSKELTLEESGLLCYLLSLPVEFKIIKKNIEKFLKGRISSGRFNTAWSALVENGYIVKVPYFENNLRRDGWMVYETPEYRDTQNRDIRETSALYNTDIESTDIKSNNKESTNSINNTGYSNTGVNSEVENDQSNDKNEVTGTSVPEEIIEISDSTIPSSCFVEALKESKEILVQSTSLGEDILTYTGKENYDNLIKLIGENQFEELIYQLTKFESARQKLKERIYELSPTEDFIRYLT
jgi:hypothetical protein